MSGWEPTSRQAAPPTSATRLSAVVRLRAAGAPAREHVRRVEDERELHQLRGLELHRPGADPALRAERADGRGRAACTAISSTNADAEQRAGQPAHGARGSTRAAKRSTHQPDRAVDDEADQRARAAGACRRSSAARRRGAVDHHRAAGEQAQRGGQQQAVLDRQPWRAASTAVLGARSTRPGVGGNRSHPWCLRRGRRNAFPPARTPRPQRRAQAEHEPPELLAARLEVAELVEARAGRAEQHDLARRRPRRAPPRARARACRSRRELHARRRASAAAICRRRLADQVDGAGARARPPRAARRSPRPCRARRGSACTLPGSNERSATSVLATLVPSSR